MHRFVVFHRLAILRLVVLATLLMLAGCGGGGGGSAGSAGTGWSISATATALPGTAAPMTGGQVSGTGSYADGDTATLVAVPDPGFAFVGWEEYGATVASADRHLTARFAARHPFVDRMLEGLDTVTIAAADFDGDGHADDLLADRVWLNNGRGGFRDAFMIPYQPGITMIPIDADGDATPNLATGYPNGGGTRIWLNNGNRRFTDSGQQLGGGNIAALVASDLDGDGDPDLVTIPGNGSPMHAWINDGTAGFHDVGKIRVPDTDSATTINDARLIDLDGDGAPELVTVGRLNSETTGIRIYSNTVVP